MVQLLPQDESRFDISQIGAGLGAGFGAGLTQGIDEQMLDHILSQAKQQGASTQDLIGNILSSQVSPEFKGQVISALQRQEALSAKAGPTETISPLAANLTARIQAGGEVPTAQELAQLNEKEARLVLRSKEVVGPEAAEEVKGKVGRANKFLDKLQQQAEDARGDVRAFNTMEIAVNEGNLDRFNLPAIGELFNVPGLDTPGSAAFKAGQLQLFSKLKEFYGGRLNEREFNSFLERVPTLFQSKESKLAAINIFKTLAQPMIEADALADRLEEQGLSSKQIVQEVKKFKDSQAEKINADITRAIRGVDPEKRQKDLKKTLFGKK